MLEYFKEALAERPWNSRLQLLLGGLMVYFMGTFAGPYYGCGPGNSSLTNNVFSCDDGSLPWHYKLMVVACIGFASLCWGRAVSLLESRETL